MNQIILNHVVYYGAELPDVLCAKLTVFYNKVILDCCCRIILLLSQEKKPYAADKHKELFDEVVVTKFDPTRTQFWSTVSLYKFLYFINYSDCSNNENLYIENGKIFTQMPDISQNMSDIVAARKLEDIEVLKYTSQKLYEYCDLEPLPEDELVSYDFSMAYLTDKARTYLRQELKKITEHYHEYIDETMAHAIMSYLACYGKKSGLAVGDFGLIPVNIRGSKLIEDFYVLI